MAVGWNPLFPLQILYALTREYDLMEHMQHGGFWQADEAIEVPKLMKGLKSWAWSTKTGIVPEEELRRMLDWVASEAASASA